MYRTVFGVEKIFARHGIISIGEGGNRVAVRISHQIWCNFRSAIAESIARRTARLQNSIEWHRNESDRIDFVLKFNDSISIKVHCFGSSAHFCLKCEQQLNRS